MSQASPASAIAGTYSSDVHSACSEVATGDRDRATRMGGVTAHAARGGPGRASAAAIAATLGGLAARCRGASAQFANRGLRRRGVRVTTPR